MLNKIERVLNMNKNIADALERECKDTGSGRKITCKTALRIADELGVDPSLVGETANQLGIKIIACQLGCFK
jgi:hypothetical protein